MTIRSAAIAPGLLDRLREASASPCVTLQVPITTQGFDRDGDRIVPGNLVDEAREKVAAVSGDASFLDGLEHLDLRALSRGPRARGLLVFRSPDVAEHALLPHAVEPRVSVGHAFALRPLLEWEQGRQRFWLLVLDANAVALWAGRRSGLVRIDLPELPEDRATALLTTEDADGTKPGRHGQVGLGEEKKALLERFFERIDEAVAPVLRRHPAPLVLAGVDYYRAIYEGVDSSGLGVSAIVGAGPESSLDDLHRAALEAVEALPPPDTDEQPTPAERWQAIFGRNPERASDLVEVVLPGVRDGAVETLLVARDRAAWGCFEDEGASPRPCEDDEAGAEDLVDVAVRDALRTGATVHVLPAAEMPTSEPLAAVWRYPQGPGTRPGA